MAAELAGYFELKGNSRESIHICRNKVLFREKLHEHSVKQPKYDIITSESELYSLRSEIDFPCVCKVADDSGSNNVRLCSSWEELEEHALKILKIEFNGRGQKTMQTVLVEEYIEGPEFSVEMFSWDGVAECIGITEKAVTGSPYFVEYAHIFPAKLSKEKEHHIIEVVNSTLKAVKFTNGASHTEIKLTDRGAYVIETNARLPGGMIPELVKNSTGIDLLNSQILSSVGIKPEFIKENLGVSGIYFFTVEVSGILRNINNLEQITEMAEVKSISIYINEGEAVQAPENFSHRIGHVIVAGTSYEEVNQLLKQIDQLTTYSIDPLQVGQKTLILNGKGAGND
ncbi:ATP-grasp domain-containing protein [Paenibacillus sp. QZ-Y1]|uniref:ATP-grasp domain-containing protein n=1 Tax=Paenibacillus sp. QZ-Y1 TaxID=3414511 RepID=UPI003F7A3282